MNNKKNEWTIEDLIREYVSLRKRIVRESKYRLYPYYSAGIKEKTCNPINIIKLLISLFKSFRKKEYPEEHDFKFAKDTFKVFSQIYEKVHSSKGLEIGNVVLSRKELIEAKYILDNIVSKKESYLSYLNFALGFIIGFITSFIIPIFFPNLIRLIGGQKPENALELLGEFILFSIVVILFWGMLLQFSTNTLLKMGVDKELIIIINRRLNEFEIEEKLKGKGENHET